MLRKAIATHRQADGIAITEWPRKRRWL